MNSAGACRAELEKRILRLHKGGAGILKIGKTLGIGTGTVQRVLMEQPTSLKRLLPLSETETAAQRLFQTGRKPHVSSGCA